MDPTSFSTALAHPATARAARRAVVVAWAGTAAFLALCAALFVGFALLPVPMVSWGIPTLSILAAVAGGLCAGAATRARLAHHRRTVLRTYPWQRLYGALRLDSTGRPQLVLPDPDDPRRTVRLSAGTRPTTREALPCEVWLAGDPRFVAVLALPGPRRMTHVAQPSAGDPRLPAYDGPLGEEARRRALAVGARVATPASELERGPVPAGGLAKVALHHPETAAGYRRVMARRRLALYGQLAVLAVFFTAISLAKDPDPLVPVAGTLMIFAPLTLLFAGIGLYSARRLGKVLRVYPWQEMPGEAMRDRQARVVLRPGKGQNIPLRPAGMGGHAGAHERYWFAGDLRYGGALSGPNGARPVPMLHASGKPARKKRRATPEADALAERAGLTKAARDGS